MSRGLLPRAAAAVTAALLLVLGVRASLTRVSAAQRSPSWEHALAPLAHAPIPSGHAVALVAAGAADPASIRPLLYEASWQRPDLRFALAQAPEGAATDLVVTMPGATAPADCRAIWSRDGVTLWRRAPR